MNQNGCLLQLSTLIAFLLGGLFLLGPTIGTVVETEPSVVITEVAVQVPSPTFIPTQTETLVPTNIASNTATFTPVPTNTPTNTATFTPLPTDTPTNTATFTPSFTPLPTDTPTNTPTFTPTFTPTPATLCELRVNRILNVNVREEPNASTALVVQLPNNTFMDVYEQAIGFDGLLWFFIEVEVEGETYEGWVRSDLVEQVTECPPLEP